MSDALDPAYQPKSLDNKQLGGKRYSKLPVILAVSIVAAVMVGLIFATSDQSKLSSVEPPAELPSVSDAQVPKELTYVKSEKKQAQTPDHQRTEARSSRQRIEPRPQLTQIEQEQQRIQMERYKRHYEALEADMDTNIKPAVFIDQVAPTSQLGMRQFDQESRGSMMAQTSALSQVLSAQSRDPNMQDQKHSFKKEQRPLHYLNAKKERPISPYELKTGHVLPAVMITGINSDLPGDIIGQVSQNVYDTATGNHLLVPQGTKVFGSYDSHVSLGQSRAMIAWRRLIFPDGATLELGNMQGHDQAGYAGFSDQVDNHYFKIFGSAVLMSLIGSGYQLSQPESSGNGLSAREIVAAQIGQNLSKVSSEMIKRNLKIQPTIKIRPGYRFNVLVSKDIVLEPYQGSY